MLFVLIVGAVLLVAAIAAFFQWKTGRDLYGIQFLLSLVLLAIWSIVFVFFIPDSYIVFYGIGVWLAFAFVVHLFQVERI